MIKIENEDFEKLKNRITEITNYSKLYGKIVNDLCQLQQVYDCVIKEYLTKEQLNELLKIINKERR